MNDRYTKLMLQQTLSPEAEAAFFEKLERASKKRKPAWKAAVVAACICLLVPVTAWAAENIFGTTKVIQCERPVLDNIPGIGLDVLYDNIENYPIKEFPRHLQKLEEGELILHNTWEEAEAYLGIDLIGNTVLTADDALPVDAFNEPTKFCQGYYGALDGQFLFAEILSAYKRNDIGFLVTATVTTDLPTANESDYHNHNITYIDEHNRKIHTQQYTTQAGIPVLIVSVTEDTQYNRSQDAWDELTDCFACFAVDNVSYEVRINSWTFVSYDLRQFESPEAKVMATLKEVLEGFTLE